MLVVLKETQVDNFGRNEIIELLPQPWFRLGSRPGPFGSGVKAVVRPSQETQTLGAGGGGGVRLLGPQGVC